jgi:hypothetical protein
MNTIYLVYQSESAAKCRVDDRDTNEQPQPLADAFELYRSMHGIGTLYCGISRDRLSFSEKEIQAGLLSGKFL